MQAALEAEVPGNAYSFTQPIELRVQELVAGVRSDVGLSLYGDDLEVLEAEGDKIVRALDSVPGAADVQAQQIAGLPYVRVIIRRDKLARYGINAAAVLDAVRVIGGHVVGEVFEGQRRFPLQVRLARRLAARPRAASGSSRSTTPQGRQIPLSQLADIVVEDGPAEISRDAIRRRLLIQCNVRGRDLAGFVAEAQATVDREVALPAGLRRSTWGGQFENLERASSRLLIAVPVALLLIFSLLYLTFGSVQADDADLSQRADRRHRRDLRPLAAGHAVLDLGGGRLHRPVRHRRHERRRAVEHIRHLRQDGRRSADGGLPGLARPAQAGLDDGHHRRPGLRADGRLGERRGRGPAAAGDGRDRRPGHLDMVLTLLVLPAIYRWFEPAAGDRLVDLA